MNTILLLLQQKRDRQHLEQWLAKQGRVVVDQSAQALEQEFDLAVIDGPTIKLLRSQVLARRKAEEPVFLPFLLLTVHRKDRLPTRHLGSIVDDLVLRPLQEAEVKARVANLLRLRRLSLDLKKEHDRVVRLTVTDDVSGYHNTRYLHRHLDRLFASPSAKNDELSLVFLDLDNFKNIVDTHGHLLGSKALREVAQCLAQVLGDDDRLVRYGGDEYIAILPRQGKEQATRKVQRLREVIEGARFLTKEGINAPITASFGIATYPHDAADKRELLAQADRCLFRSKSRGKNRITVAGDQLPKEEDMVLEPL